MKTKLMALMLCTAACGVQSDLPADGPSVDSSKDALFDATNRYFAGTASDAELIMLSDFAARVEQDQQLGPIAREIEASVTSSNDGAAIAAAVKARVSQNSIGDAARLRMEQAAVASYAASLDPVSDRTRPRIARQPLLGLVITVGALVFGVTLAATIEKCWDCGISGSTSWWCANMC